MKRKILIVLLSIVCALCLALGLSACDLVDFSSCSSCSGNVDDVSGNEQTDGGTEDDGSSSSSGDTSGGSSGGNGSSSSDTSGGSSSGNGSSSSDTSGGSSSGNGSSSGDTSSGSSGGSGSSSGDTSGGSSNGETTHTHTVGTVVTENEIAATCVTEGSYDIVVYCTTCGEELSRETITVPVIEHSYNGGVVTTEATCTENGVITYTCTVCGDTITEKIAKTEHTYDSGVVTTEATCTEAGIITYTCTVCGATITEEIAKTDHNFNSSGICTVCGVDKSSNGLEYTLSNDGTYYTVTGIGTCTETDLVILSTHNDLPVTAIAKNAFKKQTQLTNVYVPNSVTSIGEGAFSGCSSLVSITLPFVGGSVKTSNDTYQYPLGYIFGTSKYTGGTATKQYYYGSSISSITNTTYYIPTSLTTVTITGGNILYGVFRDCTSLTSVIV